MDMDSSSIPISLLRQAVFCRRIPFFHLAMGIDSVCAPRWVSQGVDFHEKVTMLSKRRNLSRFGIKEQYEIVPNVQLRSERLNLHGICDAVLKLGSGEVVPLEFKLQETVKYSRGAAVQLAAYAMLAEECFKTKVRCGYILFGHRGKVLPIKVDDELRHDVSKLSKQIRKDSEGCRLPDTCASEQQCAQCEYQNFCADRY